jgi:hypothetical protein
MFRRLMGRMFVALGVAACGLVLAVSSSRAQDPAGACASACASCGFHCQQFHCPPVLKWCMEGAPRICFRCGCPKPICNPCEAPNWGYYQKCWSPWPWPPDWSHCPVPTPASQVFPGMLPAGQAVRTDDLKLRPAEVRPPL